MSDITQFTIESADTTALKVGNATVRPNDPIAQGGQGLNAVQLKAKFDAYCDFLVTVQNSITDYLHTLLGDDVALTTTAQAIIAAINENKTAITNIHTDTDGKISTHNTASGQHATQFAGKVDKAAGSSLVPDTAKLSYDSHLSNTSNPHSVTKTQVGLGNCDNTSDANKPVSTAGQTALDFKVDKEGAVTGIKGNAEEAYRTGNVNITPANIGAAVATDTYTKTEIDNKLSAVYKYKGSVASYANLPTEDLTAGDVYNVTDSGINYAWTGTAWDDIGGIEALATVENAGLMSSNLYSKLVGIAYEAQVNVIETIKVGESFLSINGKTVTIPEAVPTGEGQTDGLMTHEQAAKLSGIAENANNYSLPKAGAALGGIKASEKTTESVEAKIGDDDKLYVPAYPAQGTLIITGSLTVSVADWAAGTTCTKAVTNLTTNDDIMLCPDDETAALIAEFGVVRPTQDDDELDFTADSTPDDDLVYLYHIYKGVR
ncbi:MAG: hypothetical protein EOM51_10315 [Clostridia bacterium]|nr:hypothetical protein [Clostridia bacterium]